jgi:hypothetical protein
MRKRTLFAASILTVFVLLLATVTAFAGDTKTIHAKALSDHECNSTEWHFVINQIDEEAHAPSSIHVEWANGASADVSLDKFTGGVAHYVTTANLDSTVTSASAEIYSEWDGQFNLSHGPCPAEPTDTPVPSDTPTPSVTVTPGGPTATPTKHHREATSTPKPGGKTGGEGLPQDSFPIAPIVIGLLVLGGGFVFARRRILRS